MYTEHIHGPTLILNERIARANIRRMAEKARAAGVSFRPHFKTHQSHLVGEWYRENGVKQITVSSVDQAMYFAEAGWTEITIGFPCNVREMQRLNLLAKKVRLGVIFQSVHVAQRLAEGLEAEVDGWVELDIGDARSGLHWADSEAIEAVARAAQDARNIRLRGLLGHAGYSYGCRGENEILRVHRESLEAMAAAKAELEKGGFHGLQVSVGDTPTCSVAKNFPGVDEIRPGNFVFYDLVQAQVGSCSVSDIAVALAAPVVAKNEARME
ncbi:MAG: alanine racemase, partial [Bacteroidota bacterium]